MISFICRRVPSAYYHVANNTEVSLRIGRSTIRGQRHVTRSTLLSSMVNGLTFKASRPCSSDVIKTANINTTRSLVSSRISSSFIKTFNCSSDIPFPQVRYYGSSFLWTGKGKKESNIIVVDDTVNKVNTWKLRKRGKLFWFFVIFVLLGIVYYMFDRYSLDNEAVVFATEVEDEKKKKVNDKLNRFLANPEKGVVFNTKEINTIIASRSELEYFKNTLVVDLNDDLKDFQIFSFKNSKNDQENFLADFKEVELGTIEQFMNKVEDLYLSIFEGTKDVARESRILEKIAKDEEKELEYFIKEREQRRINAATNNTNTFDAITPDIGTDNVSYVEYPFAPIRQHSTTANTSSNGNGTIRSNDDDSTSMSNRVSSSSTDNGKTTSKGIGWNWLWDDDNDNVIDDINPNTTNATGTTTNATNATNDTSTTNNTNPSNSSTVTDVTSNRTYGNGSSTSNNNSNFIYEEMQRRDTSSPKMKFQRERQRDQKRHQQLQEKEQKQRQQQKIKSKFEFERESRPIVSGPGSIVARPRFRNTFEEEEEEEQGIIGSRYSNLGVDIFDTTEYDNRFNEKDREIDKNVQENNFVSKLFATIYNYNYKNSNNNNSVNNDNNRSSNLDGFDNDVVEDADMDATPWYKDDYYYDESDDPLEHVREQYEPEYQKPKNQKPEYTVKDLYSMAERKPFYREQYSKIKEKRLLNTAVLGQEMVVYTTIERVFEGRIKYASIKGLVKIRVDPVTQRWHIGLSNMRRLVKDPTINQTYENITSNHLNEYYNGDKTEGCVKGYFEENNVGDLKDYIDEEDYISWRDKTSLKEIFQGKPSLGVVPNGWRSIFIPPFMTMFILQNFAEPGILTPEQQSMLSKVETLVIHQGYLWVNCIPHELAHHYNAVLKEHSSKRDEIRAMNEVMLPSNQQPIPYARTKQEILQEAQERWNSSRKSIKLNKRS